MADIAAQWIKAQRCHASGSCVEIAPAEGGVLLRSSLAPDVVTRHSATEFAVFVEAVKNGEFDHLT